MSENTIFSVADKHIIVTGGCGFLGQHIVAALEAAGATITIFDTAGEEPLDITDAAAVTARVERALSERGRIDGLVHAAAIDAVPGTGADVHFSPYEAYPMDVWQRAFAVNVEGAQVVTSAVAPALKTQKSGSVVFLASDLGVIAPNNTIYDEGKFKDIAYTTSKAAVIGLARNWATYLGSYGVRSNALSPGGVYNGQPDSFVEKNSALNMLGRMATPDEYNGAIQFLLSDASSYMTGANMIIDGGRSAW